jgi:hypothetical protein
MDEPQTDTGNSRTLQQWTTLVIGTRQVDEKLLKVVSRWRLIAGFIN